MADPLDNYKLWRNRIDAGVKRLKTQSEDWDRYEDAYNGKIVDPNKSGKKIGFSVNLQYVDVRSSIPKLYSQNPYIYIDPETPEADLNAEVLEKVVNVQKERAWKLKERVQSALMGAKLKGRAYLKISYKFDSDKIGRDFVGDEPNDEITINYVSRKDLILDGRSSCPNSSRWVAHEIRAPISDIRKKFKLKKEDKISINQEDIGVELSSDEKEDFQYGCYYEIENRVDRTLAIIVDGLEGFAVEPYKHPYSFHSMYEALEWNQIPGCEDTKPDLHFWFDQLLELAYAKTQQVNHRRKLNAKYKKIGPGELTDEQIKALKSYEDSSIVDLKVGQDIVPFEHAQIGKEAYMGEQSTRQDITIISGMNEMKQGLPQVQKTAREAMAIVSEAQDVMSYRAAIVEDFVARVIEKCIVLIQENYDATRVVSLSGMEEADYLGLKDKFKKDNMKIEGDAKRPFLSYVGKDLVGKMRVRVKAGSAMPVNEGQRKADITQLIDLMGKSQQVAAAVDSKELLKEIAKLLHIENKQIIFDAKTPFQENSLLKRDVPVMPHLNEPHDQHIAAHEMESNNTPAFIAHLLNHKLMKALIERSTLITPVGQKAPGGMGELSASNISGVPQGSQVPPEALPQPPSQAVSPAMVQQPPAPAGIQ